MLEFKPAYIQTHTNSLLQAKVKKALKALNCCTLCPRKCKVDRNAGDLGFCRTGRKTVVASYQAHFGEEEPLVGQNGSGTIFFTHCNLLCNFCQNYSISHLGEGCAVMDHQLADIMLRLQQSGCHNINFVTPSHVVPQILSAVSYAVEDGLTIPLIYNTGGYDCVHTLRLLEGVVDIYMPDFKFWNPQIAAKTCQAPDYPEVVRNALKEMHRQVGDLQMDTKGHAIRGLLVRHLVLPDGMADTQQCMRFIAQQISSNTYVNIMPQYRPCGQAHEVASLAKVLSPKAYEAALQIARDQGIIRLDQRHHLFFLR